MKIKLISVIVFLLLSLLFIYKSNFNEVNFSCSYRLHHKSEGDKNYYILNSLIDNNSRGHSLIQGTLQDKNGKVYINRRVSFNYQKEGHSYKFKNTAINLLPTDTVSSSPESEKLFESFFPGFYYEKDAEMHLDIFPQKNGGFVVIDSATQILFCEKR